jgi:hypothetical protein
MKNEKIKVTVTMPRQIHSFITKLAAVEGSKADEWYVDMIVLPLVSNIITAS